MPKLTDRYDAHPLHNTLRTLQTQLTDFNIELLKGLEDALDSFERLSLLSELTRKRLEATDPNLVATQTLTNLNSSYQAISNELSAFKNDKNVNRFANVNNHAESILVYLSNIVVPSKLADLEGMRDAVTNFRRSVGQLLRSIDEEGTIVKTKLTAAANDLAKLSNDINAQKQRTDAIINNFQQQFSAAEDKRRSEFTAAENERKKKSDALFTQKESEWNKIMSDKKSEYDALLKQTGEALASLQSESSAKVNGLLEQMNQNKKKSQDLVGIITDTGMVGGYQRVANEERKSAHNWRKVALGSLIALVGFAVFAFVETLGHEIRWDQFATRIFVAVSFGILAAYAALQADKHERSERRNRKTELELASILPYLHDLPQDKQFKIREELAMRMFGQAESLEIDVDKKTTGSIMDVLKLAVEAIGNLSKK
jgi:hypothetical protein